MDFNKFTIKAQEAVQRAQQFAVERDHQAIEGLSRIWAGSFWCGSSAIHFQKIIC